MADNCKRSMNTLLHGNFSKTVGDKMFVILVCVPTQERGNEVKMNTLTVFLYRPLETRPMANRQVNRLNKWCYNE